MLLRDLPAHMAESTENHLLGLIDRDAEHSREMGEMEARMRQVFFFFFTLVTGPGRSLSLKLSDARVYEPQIRARLGTTTHSAGRSRR